MTNRLATESSPYLRQHADNPVDWYPWGSEALEKARAEDKPIFLSVGYSACHWCHVMAHESFEDEEIARLLADGFIAIKVDREERPDVDAIYMEAVQALTGSGGWPLSVFLTAEAVPFYGGTYFPPRSAQGLPGFSEVLEQITRLWQDRRAEVLDAAETLEDALRQQPVWAAGAGGALDAGIPRRATDALARSFDPRHGGWGGAPKFPQASVVEFVLRRYVITGEERLLGVVARTLDGMMRGGIYDQLGGGFHRYATDERWMVPHFEKMLYDNAQLARVYLHAWQVTANPEYRQVVTGTLDYLVREMLDAQGGFYSAQDADTQGEEGRYYTWTPDEVREALSGTAAEHDDALVLAAYGVTDRGNFEGRTVLSVARRVTEIAASVGLSVPEAVSHLERGRDVLLAAREAREKPGIDDKVLASWNGLALAAFAEAARVLDRPDYRAVAERNARFLLEKMRAEDGRMLRVWREEGPPSAGYLEDQAAVAEGLLELYQTTFDARWFEAARELAEHMRSHFADESGGFFDTADDHEQLLLRPKELQDGAVPSASSVAADVLVRLGAFTGDEHYTETAQRALTPLQQSLSRHPLGLSRWLAVLDRLLSAPETLTVVGPGAGELLGAAAARYHPNLLLASATDGPPSGMVLAEGKEAEEGVATAYYCHDYHCERPVTCVADLDELLGAAGAGVRA